MLSFYFTSENLYGLPERATNYQLNVTRYNDPYRVYAIDKFPHDEFDTTGLYSGIPYVMGHGKDGSHDEGVVWLNSADTYVDIFENKVG